jgi:hypothetical protein
LNTSQSRQILKRPSKLVKSIKDFSIHEFFLTEKEKKKSIFDCQSIRINKKEWNMMAKSPLKALIINFLSTKFIK